MRASASLADRVWARVVKRSPDECWDWTGATGDKGQPTTTLRRKSLSVRRVLWELVRGETLPRTRHVATTCAVPGCVNPDHFYLRPWQDDGARFWTHVEKGDGCWIWTSTFFVRGYGAFKMQGKERQAHRVAWELTNGPIGAGLFVCHRCDNPKCVRPDHLFLGTVKENNHDMIAKGRNSRGERHAAIMRAARERRSSDAKGPAK